MELPILPSHCLCDFVQEKMPPKQFGLSRDEKIGKRAEFDKVFREGGRIVDGVIYARYVPNALAVTRVGIAVPSRVGKAAKRNRVRRLLREAFRLHKHEMPPGVDLILLPAHGWNEPPLGELEECMGRIAKRLGKTG